MCMKDSNFEIEVGLKNEVPLTPWHKATARDIVLAKIICWKNKSINAFIAIKSHFGYCKVCGVKLRIDGRCPDCDSIDIELEGL